MAQIGIAGLGRMGAALAARLLETGSRVTVRNRSAGTCAPLLAAGATMAESPAAGWGGSAMPAFRPAGAAG